MEENTSLAVELIKELKASSKRWFLAFIIVLGLWFGTIIGFMWHISLPIDGYETTIEQDSDNASRNAIIGGDYYGSQSESNN